MTYKPDKMKRKSPTTVNLSDELEAAILDFGAKHGLRKSVAIRFILSTYLSEVYPKTIEKPTSNDRSLEAQS